MDFTGLMLRSFVVLCGYVAVVYVGYPLLLFLAAKLLRARAPATEPADGFFPSVALVVPVHNELAVIERKLENCLALDYPPDRLEIVVLSDASDDGTCEAVRAHLERLDDERRSRVRLVERTQRSGKSTMLSEEVPGLRSEFVVFTDANAFYRPDALPKLLGRFRDPEVGLVCGRLRYVPDRDSFMSDEELYWRYEDMLKRWEGHIGRLLVANGSIYAIRHKLFQPFPGQVADDFVLPLLIAARGHRLVYEPEAVAEEQIPIQGIENLRAKARIVTRGLDAVRLYWREIIGSGPIRVLQYLLHKVCRWLMGFVLVGLFVTSAAGAIYPLLAVALAAQLTFYTLGFAAYLLSRRGPVPGVLRLPFYFLLVNAAATLGLWEFLRGRKRSTWEKSHTTRRDGEAVGGALRSGSETAVAARRFSWRTAVGFLLVMALAAVLSAETAARFTYAMRDQLRDWRGVAKLDAAAQPYMIADPEHPGNWLPRPGASLSLQQAIDYKRRRGGTAGVSRLIAVGEAYRIADDAVIFRINSDGFKGPELDARHARPRILAIGDGATFGTLIDAYSYPRSLERALAGLGVMAEVVNAGVANYQPTNVLLRLDEFQALDPEITIIYMGGDALLQEEEAVLTPLSQLYSVRALRALRWRWRDLARGRGPRVEPWQPRPHPPEPDPHSWRLRGLDRYVPSFLADLERLVVRLKGGGSRVFLATLPVLYLPDRTPTAAELGIGGLPRYTSNPYVFARLTDRTNQLLREVARRSGAELIDLDAWSRDALRPRHEYFANAIRLTAFGEEKIGLKIARVLAPYLRQDTAGAGGSAR